MKNKQRVIRDFELTSPVCTESCAGDPPKGIMAALPVRIQVYVPSEVRWDERWEGCSAHKIYRVVEESYRSLREKFGRDDRGWPDSDHFVCKHMGRLVARKKAARRLEVTA